MLRNVSEEELAKILEDHKLWLETDNKEGIRADLSYANLYNANLYNTDLSNANLSNANLYYADLYNANLYKADLYNADLYNADLSYACLSNANLSYANLYNANLSNANLYNSNLVKADFSYSKGLIYINLSPFAIYIGLTHSRIGCQLIENKRLLKTTKKEAEKLGLEAKYYSRYKNIIKCLLKEIKNNV